MILENVIKDAEEMAEIEYGNAHVYDKAKNNNLYLPNKITCEQAAKRCRERATKYRQLAEWLRKYQKIKEIYDNWNIDFGVGDQRTLFSIGEVLNGNDESGSN